MERDQEVGSELEQKNPEGPPAIRTVSKHPFVRKYAQTILDAVQIREDSYDSTAADAAEEKSDREAKESDMDSWVFLVDCAQFYKKDIHQASEEAALKNDLPKAMAYSIYLALETGWNDIIDWSQEQLGQ